MSVLTKGSTLCITSRNARFAVRSLSKFLKSSVPVIQDPNSREGKHYVVQLTRALELARQESADVDHSPLHTRRIVNILIKGRKIRNWRYQDVYLHVYHPEWKQYHLIGLSHKDDSNTDEAIVRLAMQKQVGLSPDQYSLDLMTNPKTKEITLISAPNGVLTRYIFDVKVIKDIKVDLKLIQWMNQGRFDKNWFRWFTWEEIRQRETILGEQIMFSTPLIMEEIDLNSIPVAASKAEDARLHTDISTELGYRFSSTQINTFAFLIVVLILIGFTPVVLNWFGQPNPELSNIANIIQVLGFVSLLVGVFRESRK